MNMNKFNVTVQNVLAICGWCRERNMESHLIFTPDKVLFKKFGEIAKSFLGLELFFKNKLGNQCAIYFDLDESEASKNMRARYFNYDSHLDPKWLLDPDYRKSEDFEISNRIAEKIGKSCSRIGFWDDSEIGFDLYVSIDGEIYACNYDDPILINNTFEGFLNEYLRYSGE